MTASRRSILAGALAAPFAALPAAVDATPLTQADIAKKVCALAAEMSMLLADLDKAQWEVRVGPPFKGMPLYSIDPIVWGCPEATREDLVRYYGFLWCEFRALADELGTEQHDASVMHEAGGRSTINALFGHRRPSERALAVLRLAGGRRAVAWR